MKTLKNENPNRKIGLVIFNNQVTIIGDGTKEAIVVPEASMMDYNFLLKNGQTISHDMLTNPISATAESLQEKL